jgi:SAM-dependent methyltransferase
MDERLYDQFADIGDQHWWFAGRRQIVEAVLRQSLGGDRPSGAGGGRRILDVGCGTGTMLGMLAQFGTVQGLELSPEAIAACHARFGSSIDVEQGLIPDDVPTDASWDVVGAFDVLEHLDDDVLALKRFREALRPGGRLVLTVPAFMFLWGQQDILSHHRRRYRAGQLRQALMGAGFCVERVCYFNTWLFPAVAVLRLARRLPGRGAREPRSDFDVPMSRVDGLLERIFASERHILRRASFPFGVSLLALART